MGGGTCALVPEGRPHIGIGCRSWDVDPTDIYLAPGPSRPSHGISLHLVHETSVFRFALAYECEALADEDEATSSCIGRAV